MSDDLTAPAETLDMGTASLAGRHVLDIATLRSLSRRSDWRGWLRAATHLGLSTLTATLVWFVHDDWRLLLPAMLLHGFTLVTMFAPMHECVHKTAFASPRANEVFGWLAGLLGFYNFTYYRYYHTWHHRYTQDPARDPELMTPKPASLAGYLWEISAIEFWFRRPLLFLKLAFTGGRTYPFIPENALAKIRLSASFQLALYVLALASMAYGYPYAWLLFFGPSLLAQPLLRAMLICEHTGCSHTEDGLTNTRTTLTHPFVRLFMWNMPFHTEHHLYPSIPFHQLPAAHEHIRNRLAHLAPGYIAANREVAACCGRGLPPHPAQDHAKESA